MIISRVVTLISLVDYVHVLLSLYRELQESLIRSHAAGVGPPLHPEKTRRLLALRINVLAKGFR